MTPDRVREKPPPVPRQDEAPRPGESKQQPSRFDAALQQAKLVQQVPSFQQQTSQRSTQQPQERESRTRRQEKTVERRKERDEESGDTEHAAGETAEVRHEGIAEQRVVAKVPVKRDGGGQGGREQGRGGHGGGSGTQGQRAQQTQLRESVKSRTDVQVEAAKTFQDALQTQQSERVPTHFNAAQMQRLVNLLVQNIRLGKGEFGGEELQIGFQASIFKGLRLRLRAKDGKVAITISSQDRAVRALFTNERGRIHAALHAKGVAVTKIDISEA
ncbi:MAG: hypothetical protein HY696_01430 [Deltaproteobacteria bacterium]|nr:hypothetical protein [Deltaproteobacteria bacterium]